MTLDLNKLTPAPWVVSPQRGKLNTLEVSEDVLIDTLAEVEHKGVITATLTDMGVCGLLIGCTKADAEFIALARNAFDVMMRRGWYATFANTRSGKVSAWYVEFGPVFVHEEWQRYMDAFPDYHPDPFTALVDADKWYRENVESQRESP